jgi:DNA-binding GntR family transcriptional regulator
LDVSKAIKVARLTDVGMHRDHNEDAVASDLSIGLLLLADGMGGYNAGDIAFSAAGAGADDAAAFGIDPGTPLFMVERATWTADTAITFVRLAYAPGYRLHMTL